MKNIKILVLVLTIAVAFSFVSNSFASANYNLTSDNIGYFAPAKAKTKSPVIKGKIQNNKFQKVILKVAYGTSNETFGEASIAEDGTFELQSTVTKNDIYMLSFTENENMLIVLDQNQVIDIVIDADNLQLIPEVSGSKSMTFVKTMIDKITASKNLLDSINYTLQHDKNQIFFTGYTQNFNNFYQTNNDVNRDILDVAMNLDSLKSKTDFCCPKGKLNPKYLNDYCYYSNKYLREIVDAYNPVDNFIHNAFTLYDYRTQHIDGYDSFFAQVKEYLSVMNSIHTEAENVYKPIVEQAKDLIAIRDSLVFNDLFDKKAVKVDWCQKVKELIDYQYNKTTTNRSELERCVAQETQNGKAIFTNSQNNVNTIVKSYQTYYDKESSSRNTEMLELIQLHKDDIAALMFIDNFPREKYASLHKDVVTALNAKYPEHEIVKKKFAFENTPANSTAVGSIAPELAFNDPYGKERKLSDLRGKVVLIDFWASWCRPCRGENPHVVAAYQKYHEQGFEVFSVSLDRERESWVNAIAKDGLIWENHVSDLKYWSSAAAKLYGVSSIPCTFLIDREGRILAKNLRGDSLNAALKQIFGF